MTLLQLDVPFEAESPTWVTVTAPPQLSEAVTEADVRRGHEREALDRDAVPGT